MADTLEDELNDDIEDEVDGGVAEDDFYGGGMQEDRLESSEVSLDSSHRQIHTSAVSDMYPRPGILTLGMIEVQVR